MLLPFFIYFLLSFFFYLTRVLLFFPLLHFTHENIRLTREVVIHTFWDNKKPAKGRVNLRYRKTSYQVQDLPTYPLLYFFLLARV